MPPIYTPSDLFTEGSEKDWPAKLGGLDWDSTRIVFTKRTLIEFLRYTGTSVDPNLNNIAKLPLKSTYFLGYANFGNLEGDGEPGVRKSGHEGGANGGEDYRPSRRVRSVPGGAQTFTLGDGSDEPFDTGAAKPPPVAEQPASKPLEEEAKEEAKPTEPAISGYKPSRRVREGPGGSSSMANLWAEHTEAEPFKPTRRVREGPGGTDSISQIF